MKKQIKLSSNFELPKGYTIIPIAFKTWHIYKNNELIGYAENKRYAGNRAIRHAAGLNW